MIGTQAGHARSVEPQSPQEQIGPRSFKGSFKETRLCEKFGSPSRRPIIRGQVAEDYFTPLRLTLNNARDRAVAIGFGA